MAAIPASPIAEHLHELLAPTPSAMAKLLALWDGLSLETRLWLLAEKMKNPEPAYLYEDLLARAAASGNAYERYLANKELRANHLDDDPEPLVRYARLEDAWGDLAAYAEEPARFFALPHEARLAFLRAPVGESEAVARLIRHAAVASLPKGEVSELELYELLTDYLNGPGFRAGAGALDAAALCELWQLVPTVPESLSFVLLELLPEPADEVGIPAAVLAGLNSAQKTALLARPDIGLGQLRRQLFAASTPEDPDDALEFSILRTAAVQHNLALDDEAFGELLRLPEARRRADLRLLAENARRLEPCRYAAIGDALAALQQDDGAASRACEGALAGLAPGDRQAATRRLRLYRLAAAAAPCGRETPPKPLPAELAFLRDALVPGDPWASFTLFAKLWAKHGSPGAERHLPPASLVARGSEDPDWRQLPDAVAERLAKAIATASGQADRDLGELKTAVATLGSRLDGIATILAGFSRPPAAATPPPPPVGLAPRPRLRFGVVGAALALIVVKAALLLNKAWAIDLLRTVF